MFKLEIHGDINGRKIVLTQGKCYEVEYGDETTSNYFERIFYNYLSDNKLFFKNIKDELFECMAFENIKDIQEIELEY